MIYTENFNGGTHFSASLFDTLIGSDDFLFLSVLAPLSSYNCTTAAPLASLSLSCWYSLVAAGNGTVSIAGSGLLPPADTPGNALQYLLNNPGLSSSGIGASYDAQFSTTLNNLAAGSYSVTFANTAGRASPDARSSRTALRPQRFGGLVEGQLRFHLLFLHQQQAQGGAVLGRRRRASRWQLMSRCLQPGRAQRVAPGAGLTA